MKLTKQIKVKNNDVDILKYQNQHYPQLLKNKEKIRDIVCPYNINNSSKNIRLAKHEDIEKSILVWFTQCRAHTFQFPEELNLDFCPNTG